MAYGPQATPHAFVFDKERILRYRGSIDDTENPYVNLKPPTCGTHSTKCWPARK